jgi:2-haloacid dehalogenase
VPEIKALCFDVMGTSLDWREGGLVAQLERLGQQSGIWADWDDIARRWAMFYATGPLKSAVELGNEGVRLLREAGFAESVDGGELASFAAQAWFDLPPWPDVPLALARLSGRFRVAALTNLDGAAVAALSAASGIRWDLALSAEMVGVHKPDPAVYRMAASALGVNASEILMVAAHPFDLRRARSEGFRTAYVQRREIADPSREDAFDFMVSDFVDLAAQLGC